MHKFLDRASKMYYEGKPILKDWEFDTLARKHNYNKVGYKVTDGIPHHFAMQSLQKVFDLEEAPSWYNDSKVYSSPRTEVVCSPKLDGAAISLLYVNGELELALTRGDGKLGKDITDKAKLLCPTSLTSQRTGITQITGEVVAPKEIPNSRNYASGALNLKDLGEFASRKIEFILYDASPSITDTWSDELKHYSRLGFTTVLDVAADAYPTDGIVYRLNNFIAFGKQGFTSQHPRGAFALKSEKTASAITRINKVIWQVGKSGRISPVAILEPVQIGDAIVSRATLHNISIIDELGLEIGCEVEIIRSGEIIPKVVRRVN